MSSPDVPDVSKKWCVECLGHYPTKTAGSGRDRITVCAKCESVNVWDISPVTSPVKLKFSIPFLIPFFLGLNAHLNLSEFRLAGLTAWQAYALAVVFGAIFYGVYLRRVSARKKWLIWAMKRGFKE